MKIVLRFSIMILSVLISLIYSCKSSKPAEKSSCAAVPTYSAEIKNILDQNCASTCHSAEKKKDGIDLSTYETAKQFAANKNFMGSIEHKAGFAPMPAKKPKLDDATIMKLSCWIQNGMPQ